MPIAYQGLLGPFASAGAPTAAVNEVQTITPSDVPAAGTFILNFEGHRTAALAFNAAAAVVEAALNGLGSIGAAGCSVTLGGGPPQLYTVTFDGGNMAGRALPLITVESNSVVNAGAAAVTMTVAESVTGVTPSFAGASIGAIYIDTATGALYQNTGTALVPVWSASVPAGVTASAAEINLIDGAVAGTSVASKALALGANKNTDVLALPVSGLKVGAGAGTAVDCTAAEFNTLNGVTAGTAAASKAVVLDANKRLVGLRPLQDCTALAADGAIVIQPGVVLITKVAAINATLADPAAGDNGAVLHIIATTAAAHVVDNSAGSGFNAAGGGSDIATFAAAVGNRLSLVAYGAKWYVLDSLGITLA